VFFDESSGDAEQHVIGIDPSSLGARDFDWSESCIEACQYDRGFAPILSGERGFPDPPALTPSEVVAGSRHLMS